MNHRSSCVVSVLLFGSVHLFSCPAHGQVYVSKTGDNTLGTSWSTALFALSDAVAQAQSSVQDVWIASDTYTILSTVSVPSNVNIYGGFPATGNPGFPQRDPDLHPTTLDGLGTAAPIIEYSGSTNLEIDGITFTNGNGSSGGAIRVVSTSDVDIFNCRFIENSASSMGAGIYIDTAHADIEDCVFEDNVASEAAAIMLFRGTANVIACAFRRNDGGGQGGAYI